MTIPVGETRTAYFVKDMLREYAGLSDDEHGDGTPARFLNMLDELTSCRPLGVVGDEFGASDADHEQRCIKWKTFRNDGMDEMIIVESIPFISVCNHHIVPFMGKAYVAYVPNRWIAGLSKFARVVRHFARRLQVQERLTEQVATFLEGGLEPRGVGVIMKAEHLCMTIRGVQVPGALTTTAAMRGVFADHSRTAKAEFLAAVNGGKR